MKYWPLVALGLSGSAHAAWSDEVEFSYNAKLLASVGLYDFDAERVQQTSGFRLRTQGSGDADTHGFGAGFGVQTEHYFYNITHEYTKVDFFSASEWAAWAGRFLGDTFSVSAGLRATMQGEDYGDDNFYREKGVFLGVGAGGLRLFERLSLSGSLAYNWSRIKISGGDSLKAPGYSAKLQLALLDTPHSVGIRYRQFDADSTNRSGRTTVRDELAERYLTLFYEYGFFW